MSSPKVTLQELIDEWIDIKEPKNTRIMIEEMTSMILRCKQDASMSMDDVIRNKPKIIGVWVEPTWAKAKQKNPHWQHQQWWKEQLQWIASAFGTAVREIYANDIQVKKAEAKELSVVSASSSQIEDMPVFDNPIDFLAWTKKRKQG